MCFSSRTGDPQRGNRRYTDNYDYIAPWYESVLGLQSYGIIFHDGNFSNSFIKQYTTSKIKFVKYTPEESDHFTPADSRWICYAEYFTKNQDLYDTVFVTDCQDVNIHHRPAEFLPDIENTLYVGKEEHRDGHWMKKLWGLTYKTASPPVKRGRTHNCGILGGRTSNVLPLLKDMRSEILRLDPQEDNFKKARFPYTVDMAVLNYLVYNKYADKVNPCIHPLHSRYKKHENLRHDVCFIHK